MHKIRSQIIEIDLSQQQGAIELQRQVSRLMQEEVLPALSLQFDRLDLGDAILRIPKLDIDLGVLTASNWKQTFVAATIQSISKEVVALVSLAQRQPIPVTNTGFKYQHGIGTDLPASHTGFSDLDNALSIGEDSKSQTEKTPFEQKDTVEKIPQSKKDIEDWAVEDPADILDPTMPKLVQSEANLLNIYLYFLKNGHLPWHAKGLKLKEVEQVAFEKNQLWASAVERVIRQHPNALQRLIWQTSPKLQRVFMEWIVEITPRQIQAVEQMIQRTLHASDELVIWQRALQKDKKTPIVTPIEIVDWLKGVPPIEVTQKPIANIIEAPFLAVYQAGLVLLSPYIPLFFEALNLIEDNMFKSEENQQKAIHLLWYLGGGAAVDSEADLVLHKLLCGYDLEAPLPLIVDITTAEQSECEALLEAVIRNWPALKNTSADGLRSAFMQRDGQLYAPNSESGWLLRVENRSQDVLLHRLPWGFSVVKMPWMKQMMRVEWND